MAAVWQGRAPKRGWCDAVVLFAVHVVALVAGALWSRSVDNSTVLWTANGVLTALMTVLERGESFPAAAPAPVAVAA